MENSFSELTRINEILYGDGEFALEKANLQYGTPGIQLAQNLALGVKWRGFLHVFAPRREGQLDMTHPEEAFIVDSLISSGVVFNVQQSKYDRDYLLTPIAFARNLFGQQGMLSSLELRIKEDASFDATKKEIERIAGDKYLVLDRYEQQAETFNIMNIEKLLAYVFLSFILLVACFNIIGSLSMLIIDKKEDVQTLRNLGANDRQISQIFLFEGRMIATAGAIIGIILGLSLCWIQQTFGVVRLGDSSGNFVIDAYPVSVHFWDIVLIFFTVIAMGWIAVWYPVRQLSKKLLE